MTLECTSQREFAQLVSHHILGDIDRNMRTSVMNGDGQADKAEKEDAADGKLHGGT